MHVVRRLGFAVLVALATCVTACGEPTPSQPTARAETEATAPPTPETEPSIVPPEEHPAAHGQCTVTSGEERSTYGYASGRLQRSAWSQDERVTTYTYEGDRLVSVERRGPDRIFFTLQISYDDAGRVSEVRKREPGMANPDELVDGGRRTFTYGADGRLERVVIEGGYEAGLTTFEYDAQGRMTEQVSTTAESEEPPTRMRFTYDAAGRLATVGAQYQSWTHHYGPSGHRDRTTMTSDDGAVLHSQRLDHDASGRLIARRVTEGHGDDERIVYDGTFGSGAACGELGVTPPGTPDEYQWLGVSP